MKFHFPALFLVPGFEDPLIGSRHSLSKRGWDVSIFDLATMATRHKLHMPYQLMDVMLGSCDLEIAIDAGDPTDALNRFNELRLGLYRVGVSPFLVPYQATYSINDYAGINDRSSPHLRAQMHPGLRDGITNETATVEVWPVELSLQCIIRQDRRTLDGAQCLQAVEWADRWRTIKSGMRQLQALEDAAVAAPKIPGLAQSVLHVWCSLEALFPKVQTEVSFRVALYLAQLNSTGPARRAYFDRAKKAYQLRSDVAHGTKRDITMEQWTDAWGLLMDACAAIVERGGPSTEDALLADLLS